MRLNAMNCYLCNMSKEKILSYFLIDVQRLKDKRYVMLYCGIGVFMIVYSILNGMRIGPSSDFNVFWTAGKNFFNGVDLYSRIGGAERYIYPPFAAMLFQFFALFPLKVAASIYTFINFLLFLLAISLSQNILSRFISDSKKIKLVMFLGVAFSFRFFWYHTLFVQMNELMLVLCLASIVASFQNKETKASAYLVIAAFIKVLPVFFIPWLVLRSKPRIILKLSMAAMLCLALPIVFRGWNTGLHDLQNYYYTFLQPFKEGRVEPEFHNQSLAASIFKICLPSSAEPGFNYQLFRVSEAKAALIYKFSFLGMAAAMMMFLLWERLVYKKNTLRGIAIVFIAMHLLSGITWEYHLVSLVLVYAIFALYYWQLKGIADKFFFYLISVFVVLFSFVGKDTVGNYLYHYLEGYSVVTWTLVLMFFYLLWRPTKEAEAKI